MSPDSLNPISPGAAAKKRDVPPATTSIPDDKTPPGWSVCASASRSRATFRRTDGAEVFFDRRSRPDDPLDSLRPGWNWMARKPEGTMLGHRVAAPVGGPEPEGGLFLPRKFKTAGEAMRALDRDAPRRVAKSATGGGAGGPSGGVAVALALLEARGGDLLGPDGMLLPRVGVTWEQVTFDGPLTLAVLPASGGVGATRGALADAAEATARGLAVVPIGEEDAHGLRRLAEKLVAAPAAKGAQAMREFLDFLVAGAVPPAANKRRKRILLKAA